MNSKTWGYSNANSMTYEHSCLATLLPVSFREK